MSKVRIAIIEPVGGHGGMNYYDFSLCNSLATYTDHITLYTCDETELSKTANFNFKRPFIKIYGNSNIVIRALRYIFGLIFSIIDAKKNRYQISHFHFFGISWLEAISVILAKIFRLRVVITAHDVESFSNSKGITLSRIVYGLSDKIIAHNLISKKSLIDLGINTTAIDIIHHGNYINSIRPALNKKDSRAKLGIPESDPCVLFFGQIKKVKDLSTLIQAIGIAKKSQTNIKLVIAGKIWKDDFSQYESIINQHDLNDSIILHIKYIPDNLVDLYFSACDIVALPYKRIYQSGVVLLSLSHKKPVIVSNIEGMTEIITDGVNGFVFETGNPNSLAEAIIKAINNQDLTEKIANAGHQTVLKHYSWESSAEKHYSTYEAILEQSRKKL